MAELHGDTDRIETTVMSLPPELYKRVFELEFACLRTKHAFLRGDLFFHGNHMFIGLL